MSVLRASVATILACGLCACVEFGLPTGAPALDDKTLLEAQLEQGRRLASGSLQLRGRLTDMDLTLTLAASEFCGTLRRPKLGGIFGTSESFSGAARTVAVESFRLGKEPSVVHVSPGGPLATAGIEPGDRILSIDGIAVTTIEQIGNQTQAHPEQMQWIVTRGEQQLERTVRPAAACPVSLDYALSPALTPFKSTRFLGGVPLGLLNFFEDDAHLAVVLSHQLAHLLFDREGDSLLEGERRADRIGLFLAARAGYDVGVAPHAWEEIASEYPWLVQPPPRYFEFLFPHASLARRMEGIRAAVGEVQQLQVEGRPIVPTER